MEIITKQQKLLESVDRKERESRLVMLGVPENGESFAGTTNDKTKLKKILSEVGEEMSPCTHHRLGHEATDGKKRPILVTLASRTEKRKDPEKKAQGCWGAFLSHLRNEGCTSSGPKRMEAAEDTGDRGEEQTRKCESDNLSSMREGKDIRHVIRLYFQTKVLYRDDVGIDRWNPTPS